MAVLKFAPLYMMIGFLLIGLYAARRNESFTLGQFLGISLLWPITATFAYFLWIMESRIISRFFGIEITDMLQKIFGKPGGQR